ncbi:MAG: hypothetical protein K2X48_17160 [Chitinophagaceae bacterium]|nr:hypothetical protein [Chitinophagaceae bacterium]
MKKNILLFVSVVIVLSMVSCKRDGISKKDENEFNIAKTIEDYVIKYNTPRDGEISIIQQRYNYGSQKGISEIVIGGVMNVNRNPTKTFNAGKIRIDGLELPFADPSNTGGGYGIMYNNSSGDIQRKISGLFGKKVKFSIESNNPFRIDESLNNEFYVPMPIDMEAEFNSRRFVSKSEDQTITWDVDPNNPIDEIYLIGVYESIASNNVNPSFPDITEIVISKELPDNGLYILPKSELSTDKLPTGSKITFYLARANYQLVTNSFGTEVLLSSVTYSDSGILEVKQ